MNKKMKPHPLVVIGFILALALVGCEAPLDLPTARSDFNQTYILSDQPCSPPCWQGLTIGSSTGDEVLSTLSGLEFVDTSRLVVKQASVPDFDPNADWVEGKSIVVDCKSRPRCLYALVANDRLREILIKPDDGLMLANVIESFGNPDYLYPFFITGPSFDCMIEMIWVDKQLSLFSAKVGHKEDDISNCLGVRKDGILPKDLMIVDIHYLPIEEIHDRLNFQEYAEFQGTK